MSWKLIEHADRRLAAETALLRPPSGGDVRVALGYPNTYHVGMSNLGMQAVYGYLNRIPGVACERFYLPDPDELQEYGSSGRRLFALESQRPVGEFDVLAFTVAYEHDYVNLAMLLDLAGLPLFSAERNDDHPLVLVGGAVTLLDPEPIADFVDVFCVGEGEGMVEPLVDAMRRMRGRPRRELLLEIANLPGFYVPTLYAAVYEDGRFAGLEPQDGAPERIHKNYITAEAFRTAFTASHILTEDTEFGRSGLVEVSRGCPYVCRFCTVGFSYTKVRWKPVDLVWEMIEKMLEHTDRVGLISATVGNHPDIRELCRRLLDRNVSVSFSSLRADRLPDEILETLVRGGSHTMTLAPETGSDEMRKSINKRFTDEQYLDAARRAFRTGVKNIRMYSMVGLPNEADAHIDALVRLVHDTRRVQREEGMAGGRITLSMGQFIPKPLTPFQWSAMAPQKVAAARMKRVERALGGVGGVQVSSESPKWAMLQGLLARGDRRVARVIASVYRNPSFREWLKAFEREGIDVDREAYEEREAESLLPWSHLDSSWSPERLLKDRERAARTALAV